jgi:formimidoylglutamate deiminase
MQILWAEQALTPTGWAQGVRVVIDDRGWITEVIPRAVPERGAQAVGVLLPALANLHSHAFQHAMAGLGEARAPRGRESFWSWREAMYAFVGLLTPQDLEAIAAWLYARMLEAGFAAVGEFHYLHHRSDGRPHAGIAEMSERIVAAAARTGIGLTLLPVLYRQGGADGRPLSAAQQRFGCTLAQFEALHQAAGRALRALPDDARLGVAPHSLRAVSPADLAYCQELAGTAPLHMHVAEQPAEVEQVQRVLGARPIEWLLDHQPIDERWCLIHCTQATPAEIDCLARSAAVVGLCPTTEASLGDGTFAAVRFLDAGGRFGIGTDANLRPSVFEELRWLEYTQRLRDGSRAALATCDKSPARTMWEVAARGGAQALGREAGRIAAGCRADLVALDMQALAAVGLLGDERLDAMVFAQTPGLVCDVWAAGRHVVREGRHQEHDRLLADYRATLQRLRVARL